MAKRKRRARAKRLPRAVPDFRSVSFNTRAVDAMTAALEGQHRLHFAVRWVTQKPLVLLSLQVKTPPDNLWVELLTNPLTDNDGEIVVDMGMYSVGAMTIRFEIGALAAIPKAATYIVENETKVTPFKPAAGLPPKALDQGERWKEAGAYTVGAGE